MMITISYFGASSLVCDHFYLNTIRRFRETMINVSFTEVTFRPNFIRQNFADDQASSMKVKKL